MVMLDLQFECDFIDYRNVELHNFFSFSFAQMDVFANLTRN